MDTSLFFFIHGFVGQAPLVDWIGIFFARYLAFVLVGILVGLAIHNTPHRKIALEALTAALVARFGVVTLIRLMIHRARPFVREGFETLINVDPSELYGSFPSGHAAFFFALATIVWFYNRRLGHYFFAGAILMGIGRIFVGVHWPTDILGGAVVGILVGVLVHALKPHLHVRRSVVQ